MLLALYLLEAGLLLILAPWTQFWDRNYFAALQPLLATWLTHPFVRGAVSGVGIVSVVARRDGDWQHAVAPRAWHRRRQARRMWPPRTVAITDHRRLAARGDGGEDDALVAFVAAMATAGVDAVQVRERDWPDARLLRVTRAAVERGAGQHVSCVGQRTRTRRRGRGRAWRSPPGHGDAGTAGALGLAGTPADRPFGASRRR